MNILDQALMPLLNRGATNAFFDWLMPRITKLHQEAWFWIGVVLFAGYTFYARSRRAKIALVCAIVAVGLSDLTAARLAKKVIPRDRPCCVTVGATTPAFPDVRMEPGKVAGKDCPGSPSFPSNHASNMMALAVVGWWFTRGRRRWLWFLLPLVIGYSRVYLGFHYPTDVLGGWVLGTIIAGLILLLARRWDPPDAGISDAPTEVVDTKRPEGRAKEDR